MAFQINGVEVFSNAAVLSKTAITQQRDGDRLEVSPDDEVLVYDATSDSLMRTTIAELFDRLKTDATETFLGNDAGFSASRTSDNNNTAVGAQAVPSIVDSIQNTALGYRAGFLYAPGAGGGGLTAAGWQALSNLTTGDLNTGFGYDAGPYINSGNQNVFLGSSAGQGLVSGANNTFIGDRAGGTSLGSSDFYGSGNLIIGNNHQGRFQNSSLSIGYQSFAWVEGNFVDFGQGAEPVTYLPRAEVDGGLNVFGTLQSIGNIISTTSISSPQTEGNQLVTLCRDVDNLDGSIDPDGPPTINTFESGSSKSTFKSTFTNLASDTDNIIDIVMTNNVSKCIVTTLIQADNDPAPTISTAVFYWDGVNVVTSTPLNTSLTGADLDLGPAPSRVSVVYSSTPDGFGIDVSQPEATPISGTALVTS